MDTESEEDIVGSKDSSPDQYDFPGSGTMLKRSRKSNLTSSNIKPMIP